MPLFNNSKEIYRLGELLWQNQKNNNRKRLIQYTISLQYIYYYCILTQSHIQFFICRPSN